MRRCARGLLLGAGLAAGAGAQVPPAADTARALEAESQRLQEIAAEGRALRAELERLREQLDASDRRIAATQEEIQRLRRALVAPPPPSGGGTDP